MATDAIELLAETASRGDNVSVFRLVDLGLPLNSDSSKGTPLRAATENNQLDIVCFVVERGANVEMTCCGLTALEHAVDSSIDGTNQANSHPGEEPTEMIEFLLSVRTDPKPALMLARRSCSAHMTALSQAAIRAK